MSLEEQVNRLARAIESSEANVAVREIIRQRDDAVKKLASMTTDRDWYTRRLTESETVNSRMARRISALQGVITRMKHKLL